MSPITEDTEEQRRAEESQKPPVIRGNVSEASNRTHRFVFSARLCSSVSSVIGLMPPPPGEQKQKRPPAGGPFLKRSALQQRHDQQRHDVDDLDQRVHRGTGRVLVGI